MPKPRFGSRLEVHFNSVITRDNIDEIAPLAEWIFAEELVDGHYFNLIRGDARDPRLKAVNQQAVSQLYPKLTSVQQRYAKRLFRESPPVIRAAKRWAYAATLAFHHRIQLENLEGPRKWPMPCTAGETSAVIDFDGRVRACELRPPVGRLRDYAMDLRALWGSEQRRREPERISCEGCWCTHVCFIHDSLRYSWRALLWEIPRSYLLRSS